MLPVVAPVVVLAPRCLRHPRYTLASCEHCQAVLAHRIQAAR